MSDLTHYFIGGPESHHNGCFRLLVPKLWKVIRGPMSGILSFSECMLSGGGTEML